MRVKTRARATGCGGARIAADSPDAGSTDTRPVRVLPAWRRCRTSVCVASATRGLCVLLPQGLLCCAHRYLSEYAVEVAMPVPDRYRCHPRWGKWIISLGSHTLFAGARTPEEPICSTEVLLFQFPEVTMASTSRSKSSRHALAFGISKSSD